jgi:hypothetical protein
MTRLNTHPDLIEALKRFQRNCSGATSMKAGKFLIFLESDGAQLMGIMPI